jgi:hypothetical protein
MAKNEKTSKKVATIASKGLKNPKSLTKAEIKTLAASTLTQAPDKSKKAAPAKKPAKKK